MKNIRIVFMGTPDFATETLKKLVENRFNVVAAITAPDKQAGRGQKLQSSSVKQYAISQQIPVLQPTNLKDTSFLEELKSYNADLQIVVAFRMLPKAVWAMPKMGTFNLHASLLPDYRGAAPINWAIIQGEKQTGVTTFFIDEKIDTGAIILQETTEILPRETAGSLHDKLMVQGANLVLKTIELIAQNKVKSQIQPEKVYKEAFKIHKETCRIDWTKSLEQIDYFIRGMSPYPTAWSVIKRQSIEIPVKIYEATPLKEKHSLTVGSILIENKALKIATTDGFLQIDQLQLPAKKRMTSKELLNGFSFELGDYFS